MLKNRLDQNEQIRELILALTHIARQDGARKIVEDGDDVERAREARDLMMFNVPDINRPDMMAILRLVGVLFWLLLFLGVFAQAVELPVLGHDPATGRRTNIPAHLLQRGVDTPGAQFRVLLEPENRLLHGHIDLAHRARIG